MHSLKELAERIAEAIDERREGTVGCFSIRPKHVDHYEGTIYGSAITYVFDILTRAGLAVRQELARGAKYLICRDSELYDMPKEEMARRIMQTVIEAEEKSRGTRTDNKLYEMPKEKTTKRIVLAVVKA